MQTTHIWNQFYLCRQKTYFVVILMFCWLFGADNRLFAQKAKNLPFYDDRKIHYGFQLGGFYSRLTPRHSQFFISDADTTAAIYPMGSPGFSLGVITSFRLGDELWSLRILPNVSFYERRFRFEYRDGSTKDMISEATFVEVPVLLKYKSERRINLRMYMVAGLTAGIKVGGKKQNLNPDQVLTINHNFELNYGLGFDRYMDMFKFAAEIRFAHGVPNLFLNPNNPFANGIDRLWSHRDTLYLNFE